MTTVAFNALALRPNGAGVSTYIRGLLGALRAESPATMVAIVQADAVGDLPAGVTPHAVARSEGWRRAISGLQTRVPADVTHGLNVVLPARAQGHKVVTVHDMAYFDRPDTVSWYRATAARALWTRSLRAADAVIAVSGFTADRLHQHFGLGATVVPEGVDPGFRPAEMASIQEIVAKYSLPETFALHVGTIEPRKDIPALVAACEKAHLPLVLAGARWGGDDPLAAQLLGFVPTADLAALYSAATVVAYPSKYEGFGLPPLEAMACGAAVVASRIPPLVEVLGDAAELVTPGDVEALSARLALVAGDPARREALSAAGRRRAKEYTWARTARETAAVYRSLGTPIT